MALWWRFLTGPELGPIPGLFQAREGGLADAMGWSLESFRESFRELSERGLAKADWKAGLVWVKRAIRYNDPANPNVVKSWEDAWAELPECQLKSEAHSSLCEYFAGRTESFLDTFKNHCPNHSANHCRNQEQEQDLDREQDPPSRAIPGVSTPEREPTETVAVTGDQPGRVRPTTAHNLIHCLKVAMERQRPERGPYHPGSFCERDAGELLRSLQSSGKDQTDEVERRIALFVADDGMSPWTVLKFCRSYNGLGAARASPPPRVRGGIPADYTPDF
jgi:hypothetical protein